MVLEELAAKGTRNPPDQPVRVDVESVVRLNLLESLLKPGPGAGFSFFPSEANNTV
jgi:hypothetical protein